MKRLLVLSLVLVACMAVLSGCGGNGDSAAEAGGEAQPGGAVGAAEAAACAENRSLISSAAKRYEMLEGAYPDSLQELVPGYLQSVPSCPSGGSYRLQGGTVTCSVHGR